MVPHNSHRVVDGQIHNLSRVSVYSFPLTKHSTEVLLDVALRKDDYQEKKVQRKLKKNNIVLHCGDKDRNLEVDTKGEPVTVHLSSVGRGWSVNLEENPQGVNISSEKAGFVRMPRHKHWTFPHTLPIIALNDILSSEFKYVIKTFCLRKDDTSVVDDVSVTVVVRQGDVHHARNLQLHTKICMQPQNVCPHCQEDLDSAYQLGKMERSTSSSDDSMSNIPISVTGDEEGVTHPVQVSKTPKVPPGIDSGCSVDFDLAPMEIVDDHFKT